MDDPGARRDHAQVPEGALGPAQELVALAVPLVLAGDVEGEGVGGPEPVDLDRVVDHQVRGDERVDPGRVAAQGCHRVAHGREVHHGGHAGEVLEDDPGRHERDLGRDAGAGAPAGEDPHVGLLDHASAGVAEDVLEEDLHRGRRPTEVRTVGERRQAVEVGEPRAQAGSGAERVAGRHGWSSLARGGERAAGGATLLPQE